MTVWKMNHLDQTGLVGTHPVQTVPASPSCVFAHMINTRTKTCVLITRFHVLIMCVYDVSNKDVI